MKHQIANVVTACRVLCGVGMLLVPLSSPAVRILYLTAGLTDMIDGTIARAVGSANRFGAVWDTVADFVLVVCAGIRWIPSWDIPRWMGCWIGLIAGIKVVSAVTEWKKHGRILSAHTRLNRIAGWCLFCLPLTVSFVPIMYGGTVTCVVATAAAVEELRKREV